MEKIIHIILLILCLGVIFYFSNESGAKSSQTSEGVLSVIVKKDSYTFNHSKKIIRKAGHISEFFIVTFLIYLVVTDYIKRKDLIYLITFISALVVCASDEIHQAFIINRSSSITDVCIDSFGVMAAMIIILYFTKKKKVRKIF